MSVHYVMKRTTGCVIPAIYVRQSYSHEMTSDFFYREAFPRSTECISLVSSAGKAKEGYEGSKVASDSRVMVTVSFFLPQTGAIPVDVYRYTPSMPSDSELVDSSSIVTKSNGNKEGINELGHSSITCRSMGPRSYQVSRTSTGHPTGSGGGDTSPPDDDGEVHKVKGGLGRGGEVRESNVSNHTSTTTPSRPVVQPGAVHVRPSMGIGGGDDDASYYVDGGRRNRISSTSTTNRCACSSKRKAP